jgi:hypothetical protein
VKICSGCKQTFTLDNFYTRKDSKDGLRAYCKNCCKKFTDNYSSTENGALSILYLTMKKKIRSKRYINFSEKEKDKYRCYVTKDEFLELFEKHKKIFGYTCALTGVEIIFKKTNHSDSNKSNSISVDRLNPDIGYTKENIIFVSSKANNNKNAVTKELCIAILKAYGERGW